MHLKCYTASEIHHMTTLSRAHARAGAARAQGRRARRAHRAAAPRSSPTASAASSRPGKEHPDIWFHVHDTAHRLGIPTHCTLLYGHVETYEERIDHLLRLREQQDKTGGFLAFIPLAFHPENTVFERRGFTFQTGAADLKMLAVSRLMLDNIANIKAYWISLTHAGRPGRAALRRQRRAGHASCARRSSTPPARRPAPSRSSRSSSASSRAAGRIPVQRDTLYNEIRRSARAGHA